MGEAHFSGGRTREGVQLVFFLMLGLICVSCAARTSVSRQKLQVQKHLNRLNKPAVKTIKVNQVFMPFIFVCFGSQPFLRVENETKSFKEMLHCFFFWI